MKSIKSKLVQRESCLSSDAKMIIDISPHCHFALAFCQNNPKTAGEFGRV